MRNRTNGQGSQNGKSGVGGLLRGCQYGYTGQQLHFGIASFENRLLGSRHFLPCSCRALSHFLVCTGKLLARKPQAPEAKKETAPAVLRHSSVHRFSDGKNAWLFADTGAARTLDYFSTLNMPRRGRQEILLTNDVVDNHAAFATIEEAGAGVSIGAAYLFHRTGHHTMERWVSLVHIGAATTGSVRNYCLEKAHPATTSTP